MTWPVPGDGWHSTWDWADPVQRRLGCERVERERCAIWFHACQAGECRYVAKRENPAAICPGYLGVEYRDGDNVFFRYRLCDRHIAWWAKERLERKAAKAREASRVDEARKGGAKAGATWREDS